MIATESTRPDVIAPLPLRVRPDVSVHPVRLRGRWHWNVKDPAMLDAALGDDVTITINIEAGFKKA